MNGGTIHQNSLKNKDDNEPFREKYVNFIFLLFRGEINGGDGSRVVVAPLLRKGENDAGKTLFLAQHFHHRQVDVLFLSRVPASRT